MQSLRSSARVSRSFSSFRVSYRGGAILTTLRPTPLLCAVSQTSVRSFVVGSNQQQQSQEKEEETEKEPQQEQETIEAEASAGPGYLEKISALWSPYLTGLLVVGLGLTTYGLYGMYKIMTMWPIEIRKDLRNGLLAKRKGDLDISAQFLARAWDRAKSMPLAEFGEQPLIKLSGIGIALAHVLEEGHRHEQAYKVYEDALWQLRSAYLDLPPTPSSDERPEMGVETLKVLNGVEKMRAVALSYKLGELAHNLHKPLEEEEKWLAWSVEAVLRTVLDAPPVASAEVMSGPEGTPNVKVVVEQLGLPPWTMVHDIAAPFEALGSFYARTGNINYALPLYLQAISILIPPPPSVAPIEDKCRGAQLMGNIAELILRNYPSDNISPEALAQAESWAKKGLEITTTTRNLSPFKHSICEEAYAVMLYNVAMVREFSGDKAHARELLQESLDHSKAIGMKEGISHAQEAIQALDTGSGEIKPFLVEVEREKDKIIL